MTKRRERRCGEETKKDVTTRIRKRTLRRGEETIEDVVTRKQKSVTSRKRDNERICHCELEVSAKSSGGKQSGNIRHCDELWLSLRIAESEQCVVIERASTYTSCHIESRSSVIDRLLSSEIG